MKKEKLHEIIDMDDDVDQVGQLFTCLFDCFSMSEEVVIYTIGLRGRLIGFDGGGFEVLCKCE